MIQPPLFWGTQCRARGRTRPNVQAWRMSSDYTDYIALKYFIWPPVFLDLLKILENKGLSLWQSDISKALRNVLGYVPEEHTPRLAQVEKNTLDSKIRINNTKTKCGPRQSPNIQGSLSTAISLL